MNFEELLNYCTNINNSTDEKCLVCHIPVGSNDKHIKFKCSHIYHPECINYKSGCSKCLYCEKISIPTFINCPEIKPKTKNNKNLVCKVILKTGEKKGKFCGRTNCSYHKSQNMIVEINTETNKPNKPNKQKKSKTIQTCCFIIKTGIKKGTVCNRLLPCKYHKEIIV